MVRSVMFLLVLSAPGAAADPTLDEEIAAQKARLKQKADLDKQIAEAAERLRGRWSDYGKQLADLGVIAPAPPPPAPPPTPVDPLKTRILAAFEADGKPAAAAHVLAELYRQAADLALDTETTTTNGLRTRVNQVAASLMREFKPDALKNVREAVLAEWQAAVGKADDEPITKAEREAAAKLFRKLAEILGAVQ